MRSTLILKDELVQKAMELSKITEKTALIHAGLEALIAQYARERLAALGGTSKKIVLASRRKAS